MKSPGDSDREFEEPRSRISRLSSASQRICASLDVSAVLQEIVDAARELTDASFGVIAIIGESGQPEEFSTSGFTPDEHHLMTNWPGGPRLFEHFRSLPGPLRLPDLGEYVQSLGFSLDQARPKTFQGMPMRHGGVHVGNFLLGDKAGGGEFTGEDEEVLVLFASQAATAVANARRYLAEQRARADLEALVNTAPVGVVVFDAQTGRPVSLNEETRRILNHLGMSGRSPEQLLNMVTVTRADGRQHALAELRLAEVLRTATPVRAEEIVIRVPDGRSVTTLVNATPTRSESGAIDSVVVTFQDLSPMEGLERLRGEFLGMVSHELRVPLTSIKGSAATVLGSPSILDPVEMLHFFRIIDEQANHMAGLVSDLLDLGRIETGTLSVSPKPVEVTSLVDEARNTFLSGGGRNAVEIDLPLDLPLVLADRRRIVQVLNNLISDASKHSPETSPIRVSASQNGVFLEISVSDKGNVVPQDRLHPLFGKHQRAEGDDGAQGAPRAALGPSHMQGARGGPWRAHLGRERRRRTGDAGPLHNSGGRSDRATIQRVAQPLTAFPQRAPAHSLRRRRPGDATVRTQRPHGSRLHRTCDREPGGSCQPRQGEKAPAGPAGPGPVRDGRDRVNGTDSCAGRYSGHIPLRLRPGQNDRKGPGSRCRRLHRQAVLA